MSKRDYYSVLNISPDADTDIIRNAYRKLAKQFHPDKAGPEGKSRFQEIQEAYQTLIDPDRREIYDRSRQPRKEEKQDRHFDGVLKDEKTFRRPRPGFSRLNFKTGSGTPVIPVMISTGETRSGVQIKLRVPFTKQRPTGWGAWEVTRTTTVAIVTLPPPLFDGDIIRVTFPTLDRSDVFLKISVID